jgi:superoxide dismutase, Cu-Zn family
MKAGKLIALAISTMAFTNLANAQDFTVQMNAVNETGIAELLGVVIISKAAHGIEFKPALSGLTPGEHGFHIHENPSCEPGMDEDGELAAAMAAGDHYDPESKMKHGSPLNDDGHKGDLPVLVADAQGNVSKSVHAARLSMADIENRTLMIHVGGDNYSDNPEPLGGGGARFACGIIKPLTDSAPIISTGVKL